MNLERWNKIRDSSGKGKNEYEKMNDAEWKEDPYKRYDGFSSS